MPRRPEPSDYYAGGPLPVRHPETDTDRLAALLREQAAYIGDTLDEAETAARLIAAGVTLAPQPDTASRLRDAAQAVVDAWDAGDIEVVDADEAWYANGSLLALRAALTPAPKEADHE